MTETEKPTEIKALVKEVLKIAKILSYDEIEYDNYQLDLRASLDSELPRGTITGLQIAEIGEFIIYYSNTSEFGIFYDKKTRIFRFYKGAY